MTTIGIILLALTAIYFAYKNVKGRRGEKWLADALRQSLADYEALELGMNEIQEGYEQEYLTWAEQIEELTTKSKAATDLLEAQLEEANAHLEKHDRECLPSTYDENWRPHVTTDPDLDPPLYLVT